jgi:hypothetical protein
MRRNRVGIRLLDDNTDLHDYFRPTPRDPSNQRPTGSGQTAGGRRDSDALPPDIPTDRHGIPRLDEATDLHRLLDAAADETDDTQVLGEALQRTLDDDARGLMKQKTGGFFPPRRLSLKEKLRRYPGPQAQLDLHGDTAAKARQRAEMFIRSARAESLLTLRIIVGKGLHSEGEAVLPHVIEDLLLDLKREDVVWRYRWDKRIKRKSGGLIVYLTPDFF